MKLINLELKNFRNYEHANIDFPEGLTGIIGVNGAGKSSLVEAIAWILYGNAAARTAKEQIKRQNTFANEICQAILEFEISDDHYRVVREMRGTNLSSDASVFVNKKMAARSVKATSEYVTKALGMDREAFFTSFFAKQKELNNLSDLQPAERKNLIIKMLGIDDIDKAIELLKLDIRDLTTRTETLRENILDENSLQVELENKLREKTDLEKETAAKTEKEDELKTKCKNLGENFKKEQDKKERHVHLLQKYSLKQNELKNIRQNLAKYESEMKKLHDKKDELKKFETSTREYKKVKEALEQMIKLKSEQKLLNELANRKNNLLSETDVLKKKIESLGNIPDRLEDNLNLTNKIKLSLEKEVKTFEEIVEKLHKSKTSFAYLEAETKKLKKQKGNMDKLGPNSKCPTCLRPLSKDYSSIRGSFSEKVITLEKELKEFIKKIESLEKDRKDKSLKIGELKKKKESLENKRMELELERKEASHLKQKEEQANNEINEIEKRLKKMNGLTYDEKKHLTLKKGLKDLEKKRDTAIRLKTDVNRLPGIETETTNLKSKDNILKQEVDKITEDGKKLAFSEKIYQKIQTDFELTREKYHEIEIGLKETENKYRIVDMETERVKKNIEENKGRHKEIKELTKKKVYLEKLKIIFSSFRKHLIGRIRPAISLKTSDLFQELTDGKYAKVELDENYELQVYDNGERFPIERYSGGEKDLANLCLRLAISQLMTGGNEQGSGFIVLDEIFGSQDNSRQINIMKSLSKLANQFRQIFLITHVENIKDSLEHVINVWEDENGISQAHLE